MPKNDPKENLETPKASKCDNSSWRKNLSEP